MGTLSQQSDAPSGASELLQYRQEINVFPKAIANSGWDSIAVDNACIFAGYKATDSIVPATNSIEFDVNLSAGTWDISIMYVKASNAGILSVQIDGVEVGTVDSYAAAIARNNRVQITGIVVATTGRKRLKVAIPTKNASSTGFGGYLQTIQLRRTA